MTGPAAERHRFAELAKSFFAASGLVTDVLSEYVEVSDELLAVHDALRTVRDNAAGLDASRSSMAAKYKVRRTTSLLPPLLSPFAFLNYVRPP